MRKIVLSVLLFSSFYASSQITEAEVKNMAAEAPEKKLITENSRFLQENFYYFADIIVDRLLEINPENLNYHYRKGFITLYKDKNYTSAIKYLTKATATISKNYDMYSVSEQGAPADVHYHLGVAYHFDEQLDKAKEHYDKFLAITVKESGLIPEAKKRLEQLKVARNLMANPKDAKVVNMGEKINGQYADYTALVSLDGKVFYYTSRRPWEDKSSEMYRDPMLNQYPDDVYSSNLGVDGEWSIPERVSISRPQFNESTLSVSVDERRIYSHNDREGMGDVFYSDFRNGKFGPVIPVEIKGINDPSWWETDFCMSPDGKTIYFVSDRPGGYGKRDIYIVERTMGFWSEPKNIGGNINSIWDEMSPFVGLDNNVLYFSSNDSTSMGGFDIFMTMRDENGVWSKPVNMGVPFNSVGDDVYFNHNSSGTMAFLSSHRKGGLGEKDIYGVKLKDVSVKNVGFLSGTMINASGNVIPENSYTTLKCLNCVDNSENIISPRMNDGGFFSKLEKCKDYELAYYYSSADQNPYKETFSTNCDLNYQEIFKRVLIDDVNQRIIPMFKYSAEGLVVDSKTGNVIPNAKVELIAKNGSKESYTTADNGEFIPTITKGKGYGDKLEYDVKIAAEGYLNGVNTISMSLGMDSVISFKYVLAKEEKGDVISNEVFGQNFIIYYNFDKSDIRPDAQVELDRVVAYMNANPKLKLELGSHTDVRGSDAYNMALSKRRAASARAYIAARITNPKRITSQGYGESKLVNGCIKDEDCGDAEHEKNRRTEFIVK
jgi:outer membrane protein OmpA-like peptidoglycan-associated protein